MPGELFKAWINFLLIARQHNGYLLPIPDIAFELHVSDEIAEGWLLALIHRGLFDRTPNGIRPHDWDQYQYESDNSTERVHKHRLKKQSEKRNNIETLLKRSRTDTDSEQNRTEVTPIGVTKNPPIDQLSIETAQQLLSEYPGSRSLPGGPDEYIAARCLALAGGSVEELGRGLRAMFLQNKKPSISWAWFPKVLEQYVQPSKAKGA